MKKIVVIFISVLLMSACATNAKDELSSQELILNHILTSYNKFLKGNISIKQENEMIHIQDVFIFDNEDQQAYNQYALFDMNGDALPELHVRSVNSYDIFTYQEEEIKLWHTDVPYSRPLNNRSILYERIGGAPAHIDYKYKLFDFYGNHIFEISFSKYDSSNRGIYDENSLYIFDEVELAKEKWDSLTEKILSIDDDLIQWIPYK
ncbi:MAG: hypothetical protein LBV41_13565 [Cytophagaceae bacterium]|jgi:uncharacterized protein YcfL|nr:hypothetical protein [Cytophagaceae bacterium]